MAKHFYDTVHTINAGDYTDERLNVWATGNIDLVVWNSSFSAHNTLVAQIKEEIVGFADNNCRGSSDLFYEQ